MEVSVRADFAQIGKLAKTLDKNAATVMRKRVRKAVSATGDAALKRARSNASAFSRKIPAAIVIRTSFAARNAGVTLKTDLGKVPYARLYERGSKGSGGRYIRHPVYASPNSRNGASVSRYENKKTWRNTPTHPFFYKAVWGEKNELVNAMNTEVANALRELGFH